MVPPDKLFHTRIGDSILEIALDEESSNSRGYRYDEVIGEISVQMAWSIGGGPTGLDGFCVLWNRFEVEHDGSWTPIVPTSADRLATLPRLDGMPGSKWQPGWRHEAGPQPSFWANRDITFCFPTSIWETHDLELMARSNVTYLPGRALSNGVILSGDDCDFAYLIGDQDALFGTLGGVCSSLGLMLFELPAREPDDMLRTSLARSFSAIRSAITTFNEIATERRSRLFVADGLLALFG